MYNNKFFSSNPQYGEAYVPIQIMGKIYTPEVGLEKGTIFPELFSPYHPLQSMENIEYLKNYRKEDCGYGAR